MADVADVTNKWGTLSFAIPDFLEEVRDTVNDFAELLIAYLEIANLALEFIKGFVKAYLDPMVIIIEAIIAEILTFLRDLKQIGIYITGDWNLTAWPLEDLRGGFQAYERRMIARLVDRTDPTRPDAPSTLKVIALFGYLSVDPSGFERLINFIISMMRMFGLNYFPDTSVFPVPSIQSIKYSGDIFNFRDLRSALGGWDGTPPHKARVVWTTQPASQKHPLNPYPLLGPSGYLVTVSTIPEGIPLKFARVRNTTDKKGADGDQDKQVQPREYGDVRDPNGLPIKLFGGAEMLSFKGSDFEYNAGIGDNGVPQDGYCQVFGALDAASNEVITLESLGPSSTGLGTLGDGRGSEFFLQRTFLITEGVTLAQWFAGEYSAILDLADMPHHARWEKQPSGQFRPSDQGTAGTYYVRVWSVGEQVAEELTVPKWDFLPPEFRTNVWKSGEPFIIDLKSGPASIGNPSQSGKITFVGANTLSYLKALQTALLVLVLTRSDLPTLEEVEAVKGKAMADKYRAGEVPAQGFVLNPTGLEDARHLLDRIYPDIKSLEVADQNPQKWRSDLYTNIRRVAQELYDLAGPNARIERAIVEAAPNLLSLTVGEALGAVDSPMDATWQIYLTENGWEDPLLLEAFNPDNPVSQSLDFGFAPNPLSIGMKSTDVDDIFYLPAAVSGRETDFVVYEDAQAEWVASEDDPATALQIRLDATDGVARVYDKFTLADGSLSLPDDFRSYMTVKTGLPRYLSSGDSTPVFVVRRDLLEGFDKYSTYYLDLQEKQEKLSAADKQITHFDWPGIAFTRGMLRQAQVEQAGGLDISPILAQAALVLRVAGAEKPPADGEWIALRLFNVWPEVEEFLRALENWVTALADAVRSVADAIVKYIEFLQSQIVELQQLIRRINAIIQSFLNFAFALPEFSGLMLLSNGTDGVLADLVAAENKPSDSAQSFGGGIALVVPFAPSFIFDILAMTEGAPDPNALTSVSRPPDAIGTEGVEPGPGAPPTDEPDVL